MEGTAGSKDMHILFPPIPTQCMRVTASPHPRKQSVRNYQRIDIECKTIKLTGKKGKEIRQKKQINPIEGRETKEI